MQINRVAENSRSFELKVAPSEVLSYGKFESQIELIAVTESGETLPPKN